MTQIQQTKRFIMLGGRELILNITAFKDCDHAAGSVRFQEYQRIVLGPAPKHFSQVPR